MRTLSTKEINQLENNETIPAFLGKIVATYPSKTGSSANGPWAMQPVQLEDRLGDKIRATFWNTTEFGKSDIGKNIALACVEKKGRFVGLKCNRREYQGKQTIEIKVDNDADISFGNESTSTAAGYEPTERTATEVPVQPQTKTFTQTETPKAPDISSAMDRLIDLRLKTLRATEIIAERFREEHGGQELTPEHMQAIDSWLAIQCTKEGF